MYLLHHLLEKAAADHPGKEALVDGARRADYAAFHDRASRIAAALLRCGLERRDRVAIYLPKSLEEAAAIFGQAGRSMWSPWSCVPRTSVALVIWSGSRSGGTCRDLLGER